MTIGRIFFDVYELSLLLFCEFLQDSLDGIEKVAIEDAIELEGLYGFNEAVEMEMVDGVEWRQVETKPKLPLFYLQLIAYSV